MAAGSPEHRFLKNPEVEPKKPTHDVETRLGALALAIPELRVEEWGPNVGAHHRAQQSSVELGHGDIDDN